MNLIYSQGIPVESYNALREQVGWGALPPEEAQSGIEHSFYTLCCRDGERVVGIIRLLWDHGYIAFISDVIVDEPYRGKGIASTMMTMCIDHLKKQLKPGWKVKLSLMAAKQRESFYEQFGFSVRPNERSGAGMDRWIYAE